MKQVVKVKDITQHYSLWLTMFQSGSNITDREKSVLVELLVRRDELSRDGVKEPFLTKLLFDLDSKKIVCDRLEISAFSYANAIKGLKDKGAISEDNVIHHTLIPDDKMEIVFKYV